MRVIKKIFSLKISFGLLAIGAVLFISGIAQARYTPWLMILNPAERFQSLVNSGHDAVLDRETKLVWQACPNGNGTGTWVTAITTCFSGSFGGRKGWRLPTIEEVLSLGTPGNTPFLPNSSPFCNPTESNFWSSTTHPSVTTGAWAVNAPNGDLFVTNKGVAFGFWCVRGGQSNDSGQ